MNQHRFDALSFIFGGVFVVAGLLLLTGGIEGLQMRWVGPVVAVALGLVILFAVRPRRAPEEDSAAPLDPA
jgi:drug/metabolite transporter superfamily protein YnfA